MFSAGARAKLAAFYGDEAVRRMAEPLPSDFVSYRACGEYFAREHRAEPTITPVVSGPATGAAWHHGPLRFEKYFTDAEPKIAVTGRRRLAMWVRLAWPDVPPGWHRGTMGLGYRMMGYVRLQGVGAPGAAIDQERDWSPHARRHAAKWRSLLAAGKRELLPLTLDEYLEAYRRADQDAVMKTLLPNVLRKKALAQGSLLRFVGSRRLGGAIDAGIVTLDVPEVSTSLHVGGFVAGEGKRDSAMVGIVQEWFDHCRGAGLATADFGLFWAPGDPSDWKGFSRFKSQFGTRLLPFGRPLWKIAV